MQQPIIAFTLDPEGDPVAILACGHHQHVRHDPPWQLRAWVTSEAGRRGVIGRALECVKCDRGEPRDAPAGPPPA